MWHIMYIYIIFNQKAIEGYFRDKKQIFLKWPITVSLALSVGTPTRIIACWYVRVYVNYER